MKKTTVVILAVALLFSSIANVKAKEGRCITAEADSLFASLRPLTESCNRVGPASARWYLDGSLWNQLSHDQQQQLMDRTAATRAIQAGQVNIHLFVYSTEVGEIGPGWANDWKFRRN